MTKEFDVIVIGTGSAGLTVAYGCHLADWRVAVIDSRPFGGTCAQRGCDPKKVLVGGAHVIDWYNRMEGHGLSGERTHLNWPELIRFKQTFTEPVSDSNKKAFTNAGIEAIQGRAHFVDKTTLAVNGETLSARYVVIASGAKPRPMNIPGEEHLTTSTEFMELPHLPERIVFIGGGYISFEFAHIAARAGAKPRILHRSATPLKGFDADVVKQLVEASRKANIGVQLNTEVEKIEKYPDHLVIHTLEDGRAQTFTADMVVHGAGRVPEIDDLDLDKAGIEREKQGVTVNEYMQSVSNPAVYAAGDSAASGLPLTPVAGMEGQVVIANLLEGNHQQPDYRGVPSVVFTLPPLATVGLREDEAEEQGLKFKVNQGDSSGWFTSRRERLNHSGFKVLVEEDTDKILGAHIFGPHAEEVINLFAVAIRFGLKASDLEPIPMAYPTSSSDVSYML